MGLTIRSSAFAHNGSIPALYTCDGANVSPPLAWAGVPSGTRSLALIVDDPDAPDPRAPRMVWVHWVLYDIPATATGLPQAIHSQDLPKGTREGTNDWQKTGYGGPCPPAGRHRYFFKIYALDAALGDFRHPTKARLESAMKGHVIGHAELIGTYERDR